MSIIIPARMKSLLERDSKWYACAANLAQNITDYFLMSPVCFPDYTIHGVKHVNVVLDIADRLIPDETMEILSSRDMAVLVSAIMVHDIGMFISEDGLQKLLFGDRAKNAVKHLDKDTWEDAWNAYMQKAKRYSDRELFWLFGDTEPIEPPPAERAEMTRKDYLVYGEFIRQNHHRLAHEIVLHSFMGAQDRDIFSGANFSASERDIIGLIARSHGMPLRDTEKYISRTYGDATRPSNIPVFYLMSILRIADYLDAGQHRAPKQLEDRQSIPVPVSRRSWHWNQTVDYNSYSWHPAKKSLIIQAEPTSSAEFIKADKWLRNVQQELDVSWSVISEKYINEAYSLSILRIDSNILKDETKAELGRRFLTKEAQLKANVDLLKLLIQPLYGNDPSYGVRELIQNAVDACNERAYLEGEKSGYEPVISVYLDTKERSFTITDNGIGMNEDVLLNYYLSAGSSYRFSEAWAKDFVQEDPLVARTGKFGVGALATFLLGSPISVKTRHMAEELGYAFSFRLEQDSIDVVRIDCPVGTTIRIDLSDETLHKLRYTNTSSFSTPKWYDWIAFSYPQVKYFVNGKECHKIQNFVPQSSEQADGWYSYSSPLFESYLWKYEDYEKLYCNGIRIFGRHKYRIGETAGMAIQAPSLSLVDKACNLQIDLSRSNVLDFPDEEGFIKEAYKYYLARLLTVDWDSIDSASSGIYDGFRCYSSKRSYHGTDYVLSGKGYTLLSSPFLIAAELDRLLLVCYRGNSGSESMSILNSHIPITLMPAGNKRKSIDFYKSLMNGNVFWNLGHSEPYKANFGLLRFWGKRDYFDQVKGYMPKYFFSGTREIDSHPGFCQYDNLHVHRDGSAFADEPISVTDLDPSVFPVIAEYAFGIECLLEENIMIDTIHEYLGDDIWIPFSMAERRKKFPKAFDELQYYMQGGFPAAQV